MKRPNAALLVCLLAICGTALAQPPAPPAGSPGERLRNDGDIPGAILEFEKAYAQNPKDQRNIYNLARAYSINRQLDKCF